MVILPIPLYIGEVSEVVEDVWLVPIVVVRMGWLVVAASDCCCQGMRNEKTLSMNNHL